ncbi:enoyl-CoA hydratase-related protein [Maritalea mediterranea]|uniref:Enoyl-CoA hydratase-related protein n=1 Tax=Maritalea mediterranea TaxID=2909667 RepID=A0ABS9E849_9HYPH|nr:enoyl-CoA hydratase-related protein [Maritalea mediterranea]MCF4097621.1 enoyl-CoA hydratase-related protein [Maritalea mediterranea]
MGEQNMLRIEQVDIKGHNAAWAILSIDRQKQRNALNTELLGQIADALDEFAQSPTVRAVLICGEGEHFAAGADIHEIKDKGREEGYLDPRKAHWKRIRNCPLPLVAAVDGFCLGGGFELALMCDLIVAGTTAKFGLPEPNLGLIPGAGGIERLTAMVGRARAGRIVLGGEIVDAITANDWGIISYMAEDGALPFAAKLTERLALRAPLAMQAAKKAIVASAETPLKHVMGETRGDFETLLGTADKAEGVTAFLDKRKPAFEGK